MKIPAFFYGLTRDVKSRARKGITSLKKGAGLLEIVGDDFLDTKEKDGLLLLDGPDPLVGSEPHFHCYQFMRALLDDYLVEKLSKEMEENIFQASLETPWGLLGILGRNHTFFVDFEVRHAPFLRACLQHWEFLLREGKRYSTGINDGRSLPEISTNLGFVLVNNGIPQERLYRGLKPEDVTPFIEKALRSCDG